MKRKELADVFDDEFKHFSLVPSSRKARRLDCQLAPICKDQGVGVEQRVLQDQAVTGSGAVQDDVLILDVMPLHDPAEEHALVLYDQANLVKSLSFPSLGFKVHPDLVENLKNYRYQITSAYTPEVNDHIPKPTPNTNSMAVIPWVDSKLQGQPPIPPRQMGIDDDTDMMDTEECSESASINEGLQQQPKHCLVPTFSQNTSSTVPWW